MIDPPVLVLGSLALGAFLIRGLTGAASAIVFNATFAVLLAAGLTGGLSLLDGLYWIALSDFIATFVLVLAIRSQVQLEPFLVRLLIGSIPVNVLATLALPSLDAAALTAGLGLVLVLAGAYLAATPRVRVVPMATLEHWAIPYGMATGVLGGLYGMSGPLAVLFLSHAGSNPSQFRARVTVLAIGWGLARVSVLLLSGALTPMRIGWVAATTPALLVGLAIGFQLHRFVPERPFRAILGSAVAIAGVVVLAETLVR